MRGLMIVSGLGMLSAAAWAAAADASGHGHGSAHGAHGHGRSEGPMRHGAGHPDFVGMMMATHSSIEEREPAAIAPEMFSGGPVGGGSEHLVGGHPAGSAIHPPVRVPLRVERGSAALPQPTAAEGTESDHDGAATGPPNPTVSPWSSRPPGAAGPGRPVSGWSGPGRRGPGRPAGPRW
jgi:hypothetical protein